MAAQGLSLPDLVPKLADLMGVDLEVVKSDTEIQQMLNQQAANEQAQAQGGQSGLPTAPQGGLPNQQLLGG